MYKNVTVFFLLFARRQKLRCYIYIYFCGIQPSLGGGGDWVFQWASRARVFGGVARQKERARGSGHTRFIEREREKGGREIKGLVIGSQLKYITRGCCCRRARPLAHCLRADPKRPRSIQPSYIYRPVGPSQRAFEKFQEQGAFLPPLYHSKTFASPIYVYTHALRQSKTL